MFVVQHKIIRTKRNRRLARVREVGEPSKSLTKKNVRKNIRYEYNKFGKLNTPVRRVFLRNPSSQRNSAKVHSFQGILEKTQVPRVFLCNDRPRKVLCSSNLGAILLTI